MYQTVGHDGIYLYSKSMNLPLYRRVIVGNAVVKDKDYSPTAGDEVEDLFCLLSEIKVSFMLNYDELLNVCNSIFIIRNVCD